MIVLKINALDCLDQEEPEVTYGNLILSIKYIDFDGKVSGTGGPNVHKSVQTNVGYGELKNFEDLG